MLFATDQISYVHYVLYYVELIWESLTTELTQISTVTNARFIQKLESNGLQCWLFFKRIFLTPAIFKSSSKLFGSQGCSDDKNTLIFTAFSLRFVHLAVQFCFRCKFSFHEKPFKSSFTVAWFSWTNHNSFATHSNQWGCFIFCRQQITSNGFFVFA